MNDYYVETENSEMKEHGMEFFISRFQPCAAAVKAHIHDAIEILYIQDGKYNIFVGGEEYSAKEGDILLFRSNAIHRIYTMASTVNRYYVLKLMPSVFFELASRENAVSYVLRFSLSGNEGKVHWLAEELPGTGLKEAFDGLIREGGSTGPCADISMKIRVYQVLLAFLCDMIRREEQQGIRRLANDSAAAQIYKVLQWINKNFGEEVNAETCSRMINMSYSYFSRCFKRIIGRSFKEYLNEVRINHAEQLLVTTDINVTQIAMECGFSNVSYFISVYKAMKGRTPLSERKQVH